MKFNTYITENKVYKNSFAVRITGLPYLWTDGRATWNATGDFTEKAGALAARDFSFTQKADPLKPLDTGSGFSFSLTDDGSDYLFLLFAPAYEGTNTRLASSVTSDPTVTAFPVVSTSGFMSDIIYCGRETAQANGSSGSNITISERGLFNSLASYHKMRNETQGGVGPKVTQSPTIFKGRIVEVLCRPIDALTRATDSDSEWPIWAGIIEETNPETDKVEIRCEPLSKLLEGNWPHSLPSATFGSLAPSIHVSVNSWQMVIQQKNSSGITRTAPLDIGTYDTTGTFTPVSPSSGLYTYKYLVKCLNDSISYYLFNDTDAMLFSIGVVETTTKTIIKYSWHSAGSYTYTSFAIEGPFAKLFGIDQFTSSTFNDFNLGSSNTTWMIINNNSAVIGKNDREIDVFMDVADEPFYTYQNVDGDEKGYAKITDGSSIEIIGFDNVSTIDANIGQYRLENVERGLSGTTARKWVASTFVGEEDTEDVSSQPIRISQIAMMTRYPSAAYYGVKFSEIVLGLLLSTGDPTYAQQEVELFGYGTGLGINERFVDIEGIRTILDRADLPDPTFFWTEDGKGKETLESLLKYAGVYFVTKRFERSGVEYYGLSLETVDPAYSTWYKHIVTDAHRLQGSKVGINNNERLIINNITMEPYIAYGKKGTTVNVQAADSISDYGVSEKLTLKPEALFQYVNGASFSLPDYNISDVVNVYIQIATTSALRWLGSFAKGNYILRLSATDLGLCIQAGDRVMLTLSAVRAPDGSLGIQNIPSKCIRAIHRHEGSRGAELEFRCAFTSTSELAPCAKLFSQSGTSIVLEDNYFTNTFDTSPFGENLYGSNYVLDADWFDPTIHEDTIEVRIWEEADPSNSGTYTISARNASTITINSSLSAGLQTAVNGGGVVLMTFATWGGALSAMQKAYAYIADNATPPILGIAEAPKEYI